MIFCKPAMGFIKGFIKALAFLFGFWRDGLNISRPEMFKESVEFRQVNIRNARISFYEYRILIIANDRIFWKVCRPAKYHGCITERVNDEEFIVDVEHMGRSSRCSGTYLLHPLLNGCIQDGSAGNLQVNVIALSAFCFGGFFKDQQSQVIFILVIYFFENGILIKGNDHTNELLRFIDQVGIGLQVMRNCFRRTRQVTRTEKNITAIF